MSKSLVIVESPAKAKTIEKYLGKDFTVLASFGHVRQLVRKTGSVDPDNNFAMKYEVIPQNKKHLSAIEKALKDADNLMLATDPDREGEAISWHILEYLKSKRALTGKNITRVVFNEITKSAVQYAVAHPRQIDMDLVEAQQARTALDYLVGFNLSPLLWKKINPGLSAGRVQSPALRLIVEREDEINAFVSQEYWSIFADLAKESSTFSGKLIEYQGEKVEQFTITDEKSAEAAKATLEKAFDSKIPVYNVEKKQRRRNPAAPFTTSTLQQEASRKLRFSTTRTMRTAQDLYEGINLGAETIGLITYMRTDSVTLSNEALEDIRRYIKSKHGDEYLPKAPREYKTKAKNAQEAHEAIRPTSVFRTPESVKEHLSSDQYRLYELIWKRAIASQMESAIMNTTSIDLGEKGLHTFRVTGSTIAFPGFMSLYLEDVDDEKEEQKEEDKILPEMAVGEVIDLTEIKPNQHFTEPPPRYTEASLVKSLEEFGIGRPSTYASIISTLQNREYVILDNRRFIPTDMGKIVARFLSSEFRRIVDYEFTALMEDNLDEVANGEKAWIPLLEEFWTPFIAQCNHVEENVTRAEVAQAKVLGEDPKTGKPVSVRIGRYGPFAQIGDKDDEEKPRFASLLPGQSIDTITFEEAMALFRLPRILGQGEDGYDIRANIGRFGPYIQYGPRKFVSLKEDDPYSVSFERAIEIVEAHKAAEAAKFINSFQDGDITIEVINGRYGPYITDGTKNAKVPKESDPALLTLEECKELLAKAPAKGRRKAATKKSSTKKAADEKAETKKTATKKSTTKKSPTKKSTATKSTTAKKSTTTKKSSSKKSSTKESSEV
ncbi:DNA topoisomerase I [Ignatzschineria cameli]|uniref:DNA topoisomerase I n=1 Tax=Ignatzschineria cameli TaxID=2182793 RepID=UPI000D61CDF3|nr:DNA topoisomerase I [Ignatzschineria cameli]PWD85973.1 DNA topoisomerase I [Ignatzschineria cameli]